MILLNMTFISSSEVENININIQLFHLTSEIKAIFNTTSFEFSFSNIQPFSKEVHFTFFFKPSLFSGFVH